MLTELGRSQVEVQRCSLSSGRSQVEVQRWLTELGRSQVEVQRSSLSSEGPRLRVQRCPQRPIARRAVLRSSSARTARGSWRRVGKAEVNMGVDADMVEEKLEEEEEEEKEEEEAEEQL